MQDQASLADGLLSGHERGLTPRFSPKAGRTPAEAKRVLSMTGLEESPATHCWPGQSGQDCRQEREHRDSVAQAVVQATCRTAGKEATAILLAPA